MIETDFAIRSCCFSLTSTVILGLALTGGLTTIDGATGLTLLVHSVWLGAATRGERLPADHNERKLEGASRQNGQHGSMEYRLIGLSRSAQLNG